ncbi:peptide-methionine (S)-S-oxide reductase [Winogradskyella sp. A2]|uniref:peptide-methionine (S)-S-oxide reductase n=1 Tax=Winogradskyella sp. A2 TaxID=3366944 RepID=UPI00398C49C7
MVGQIKIAFGGGCHWCTEAVFQSLKGVNKVEQGYVSSINENSTFSEAVIVHFNREIISQETLVEIHLNTHNSSSNHSMRDKYRSAVYTFSDTQYKEVYNTLNKFQNQYNGKLVTKVYPFSEFKASRKAILNYYQKNYDKPFCERFINPKLELLLNQFTNQVNKDFIITAEK